LLAGIAIYPIASEILTVAANIVVIRYGREVGKAGIHTGSVLVASWISQYICLALFAAWMTSQCTASGPYVRRCIAASPDNVHCAIGDDKGNILLQRISFPHDKHSISCAPLGVESLWYSPDARLLASGLTNNTIAIWDVNSLKRINEILDVEPSYCEYSANGMRVLVLSSDMRCLSLIDTTTWKSELVVPLEKEDPREALSSIAISPEAVSCVTGQKNGLVQQYSLKDGYLLHEYPSAEPAYECRVSFLDATHIMVVTNKGVSVWDMAINAIVKTLPATEWAPLKEVPIRRKDQVFMAAFMGYCIYDVSTGKIVKDVKSKFGHEPQNITITPDGKRVLVATRDGLESATLAW
jgi:WD40 repeat protein